MSTIVEPLSAETPYQAEKPIFGGLSNIKKTMKIAIELFATACKKVLFKNGTAWCLVRQNFLEWLQMTCPFSIQENLIWMVSLRMSGYNSY